MWHGQLKLYSQLLQFRVKRNETTREVEQLQGFECVYCWPMELGDDGNE